MADQDMVFTLLHGATAGLGPRCGRLALQGRVALDTPTFLGVTSRGAVPHLTPDVWQVIEKAPRDTPPIYNLPPPSPNPDGSVASSFKSFVGLPQTDILSLGIRRTPAVPTAAANTDDAVQILTSVGFRNIRVSDYFNAVRKLQPDIAVAPADITYPLGRSLGLRKKQRMGDRTGAWVAEMASTLKPASATTRPCQILAPLLPLPLEAQWLYLSDLTEEATLPHLSGLALYDAYPLAEASLPEELGHLARFSFDEPASPHQILDEVFYGVDVFALPFLSTTTDAGVAFTFRFPQRDAGNDPKDRQPLGVDMWQPDHAADVSPLVADCQCYACTRHHRAFIQHLLNAKEMLGWTLLQIHNHFTMTRFFADMRKAIADGWFEEGRQRFRDLWETDIPSGSGNGPRIRGYQFKGEFNEQKKNEAPFRNLDDASEKLAEAASPGPMSP